MSSTVAYGSWAARPASTVSSVLTPSASPFWNSTMQAELSVDGDRDRLRLDLLDVVDARGARRRADPLARQSRARSVVDPLVGGPADQHLLAGGVVDRREGHLLPPLAVDGHVAHDDVDRAVLELNGMRSAAVITRSTTFCVQRVDVVLGPERAGDLEREVDVEALDVSGLGVPRRQQLGVGGDADDEAIRVCGSGSTAAPLVVPESGAYAPHLACRRCRTPRGRGRGLPSRARCRAAGWWSRRSRSRRAGLRPGAPRWRSDERRSRVLPPALIDAPPDRARSRERTRAA